MPKTILGKWSLGLIAAFIILFGLGQLEVAMGQTGGETFFDNPLLSLTMLGAVLTAVAAFVVGLVAVIKQRERSWLVYLAMLIGAWILTFALGEFLGPEH